MTEPAKETEKPNPRDRYGTTRDLVDLFEFVFGSRPDLDPYHDLDSIVPARVGISIHVNPSLGVRTVHDRGRGDCEVFPGDAFEVSWRNVISRSKVSGERYSVLANPPYSNGGARRHLEKLELESKLGADGITILPAAIGSAYWRDFAWPSATLVAALGRHGFTALVDMPAKDGNKIAVAKGVTAAQNRTEIAAILHAERSPDRAGLARRFAIECNRRGWPTAAPVRFEP